MLLQLLKCLVYYDKDYLIDDIERTKEGRRERGEEREKGKREGGT